MNNMICNIEAKGNQINIINARSLTPGSAQLFASNFIADIHIITFCLLGYTAHHLYLLGDKKFIAVVKVNFFKKSFKVLQKERI